MKQERARTLYDYLQKNLCQNFSLWELLQSQPELKVTLYKELKWHQEHLRDALKKAFPDVSSLRGLIEFGLGEDFSDIHTKERFKDHVLAVIEWAEQEGHLLELIAAASQRNQGNPYLHLFIKDTVCPLLEEIRVPVSQQQDPASISFSNNAETHPDSPNGAMPQHPTVEEKTLSVQAKQSQEEAFTQAGGEFVRAEGVPKEYKRCICRVEVPALTPAGTGFLFRNGVVITNYHVMRPVFDKLIPWDHVLIRFDYRENNNGTNLKTGVEYALVETWHSAVNAELDYVLLHLYPYPRTTSIGRNDLEQRSYLRTQSYTFHKGESIWILQHPSGGPLRTTKVPGKITCIDKQKQRVYYTTPTLNGSSGSSCMLENGSVVALHSHGSPVDNEGIPFSAILADLSRQGLSL